MSKIANLKRYAWILKNFKNSKELIKNLRNGGLLAHGDPVSKAVFKDGLTIKHPEQHSGLIGTILEIWYENAYRIGAFYKPQEADIIIDIGAHVGLFSIYIAKQFPKCKIYCFEASKQNYKCLEENTRDFENISIENLAIGGEEGWIKIVLDTNRSIDSRTVAVSHQTEEATKVLPINEISAISGSQKIALMKMDIEGAEYEIFQKIEKSFLKNVDKICMEYHDNINEGTLGLLKEKLHETHKIDVFPDQDSGHGMLFATAL